MTKSMSLSARQEMLVSIQKNYRTADSKLKKKIMEGFLAATGYDRKYAIKLLNVKIVTPQIKKKRGKPAKYSEPVVVMRQLQIV